MVKIYFQIYPPNSYEPIFSSDSQRIEIVIEVELMHP